MPRKKYSVEQIIHKLRETEVLLSQGRTVAEVCRSLGVTEQTYYLPVAGRSLAQGVRRAADGAGPAAGAVGAGEYSAAAGGRRPHPGQVDFAGGGARSLSRYFQLFRRRFRRADSLLRGRFHFLRRIVASSQPYMKGGPSQRSALCAWSARRGFLRIGSLRGEQYGNKRPGVNWWT